MDRTLAQKRAVGRPMKAPKRGKRASLSLLVRPEIKRLVDKLATASGITQSAQGEMLIEQGIAVRQVLDAMGKEADDIARGNVEVALRRLGYQRHRIAIENRVWSFWAEPGFPIARVFGSTPVAQSQGGDFEPYKEGELKQHYPDWSDDAPDAPDELPPVPSHLAAVDPDTLYLEWSSNEGWTWKEGRAGWQKKPNPPEGETK
jgi:hypothetical protein